jgi:YYY domain-containing protein
MNTINTGQPTHKSTSLSPRIFYTFLLLIFLIAGTFRFYQLNWDDGTHLHPDERYLTMVAGAIHFPENLAQYWDTSSSPLNPATHESFAGYVYGTLPLFVTRAVGEALNTACTNPASLSGRLLRALLASPGMCSPGRFTGYSGIHLVGRALSSVADLMTLFALILLARMLYGDRAALLAGALYACAVLPIQHAHFFVVDSFAAVFVIWTLTLAMYAIHSNQLWPLVLSGMTTGLAVACKISVWPVAGMVGLAGLLFRHRDEATDRVTYTFEFTAPRVLALALSGICAALAFRIAQPYAFAGPDFISLRLDPNWLDSMRSVRRLVTGQIDSPPGHQWTNRASIIFPARNMIVWGLGLPLGLTAWIAWAVMGWRTLRYQRWRNLLPWSWGTIFFLYQGTQWVKSMRYLLPIYPVFTLFAAWLLTRLIRKTWTRPRFDRLWHIGSRVLLGGVLLGAALWAIAFLHIYAQPVTRIEASRWMYDNLPTAITVKTTQGETLQVPVQELTLNEASAPVRISIQWPSPESDARLDCVTLNKVNGVGVAGEREIHLMLAEDPNQQTVLAETTITSEVPALGDVKVTALFPPLQDWTARKELYLFIDLLEGPAIKLETSVLANEHWDDSLPLRIDGRDPYHNWYRGITAMGGGLMTLYDNDTIEKREQLLNALDEVDYIVLSSNRLYGSIPRLPMRYPLTTAYYDALFDGSLGFELLAEFVSYPSLGPYQFPDQESPFEIPPAIYTNARRCSVSLPPAEEAFSVYDHPRVLIFAKTPAYSRAEAEILLPATLLNDVQWMTPRDATRPGIGGDSGKLLMSPEMREAQESGGTWSQLFNRDAWHNQFQPLAVLLWWLMVTLLGWMGFVLLYHIFPALRHRGYGLAKVTGLLLWAYPAWLLAGLHLVPHTRALLWAIFFIEIGIAAAVVRTKLPEFRTFVLTHWRALVRIEGIFLALFLAWVGVRYLNPDLWHPVVGGEKPMDFAYLNAALKSTWFPPYDPWFAGGVMNYYYFGFVLVGAPIKALGIIPSIGYNLAIPMLFAMTGVGAYTLASNLAGGSERRGHRAGLLGLLLVLLLGNLGEVQLLVAGFAKVGDVQFDSLIPGYARWVSALTGVWKVLFEGERLMFRTEWWYWNATRILTAEGGDVGAINEFPLFSFLYADLHAHSMAYPLTQLALAIAIQWIVGIKRKVHVTAQGWRTYLSELLPRPLGSFLFAALVAGALRATNTWDYPTYIGLMSVAVLLHAFFATESKSTEESELVISLPKLLHVLLKLGTPFLIVVLAELLFRPFTANYVVTYSAFERWQGPHTSLKQYLVMYGHFLLPLGLLVLAQGWGAIQRWFGGETESVEESFLEKSNIVVWWSVVIVTALLLMNILLILEVQIAWIVVPLGALAGILVIAPDTAPRARLMWFMTGTAMALSLMVELLVLRGDIGRMNTVFKFYLQVWMLLALSAAVAVERLLHLVMSAPEETTKENPLKRLYRDTGVGDAIIVGLTLLLFATALYPALAIPARVRDRWNPEAPHTLDGAVFMSYATQYEHGGEIPLRVDAGVIRWLQENVSGSPTIIEGQAEREYLWGNRVSVYTGLPAVTSWRWHQVQQRMAMPGGTVEQRQMDIRSFYNTPDPEVARQILERYEVEYVIMTPYERAYMLPEGETKFAPMVERGWLEIVYQTPEATIYRVAP